MAKTDRVLFILRVLSWFMARPLSAGLPVGPPVLVNVRGRITGQLRATHVALIEHDGHRWLAATYGDVNRLRNFRAVREETVARGLRGQAIGAVELTTEAAGLLLKAALGPHAASRIHRIVPSPLSPRSAERIAEQLHQPGPAASGL